MNKWLLTLALISLTACQRKAPEKKPPAPAVHTAIAISRDEPIYIDTFGMVNASEYAQIRPQVAGKVLQRLFQEGQNVQKNDLLYIIDPAEFEATAHKAEANVAKAKAEALYAAQALERNEALAAKEYISQLEFEKLGQNIEVAKAELASSEASLEKALIELGYCYIKAPFAGTVGFNSQDPGNLVDKNKTVLTEITRMDPLKVNFNITDLEFEEAQSYIKKGPLSCLIKGRSATGPECRGLFSARDNTINTKTGTIHLQAIIDNPDRLFWPGQYVDVKLILYVQKDAVTIPLSALLIEPTSTSVYVVKDGQAHRTQVSVKYSNKQIALIEKGIHAGDTVVTDGQFNVSDGKAVRVVKEAKL